MANYRLAHAMFTSRPASGDHAKAGSALVRKLSALGNLPPADIEHLEALQDRKSKFTKGAHVVEVGSKYEAAFVLCDGWAYRCQDLSDGRRQILGYVLPGDFIALHVNFPRTADHSVIALTNIEVATLSVDRIEEIYRNFPNLSIALSYSTAQDHTILGGQITRLGRRAAEERLAHLILELWQRLLLVQKADERGFEMPVTQLEIADLLGLTQESVSRTIKKLENLGLVSKRSRRLDIHDLDGLIAIADYDPVVRIGFSPIAQYDRSDIRT